MYVSNDKQEGDKFRGCTYNKMNNEKEAIKTNQHEVHLKQLGLVEVMSSLVCYSYDKHIKNNNLNQTLLVQGIKLVKETE
jgi:hypothetical protein